MMLAHPAWSSARSSDPVALLIVVEWLTLDSHSWTSVLYMFVVSGHLYRPLLLSQSWELGGKILGGFGTHPPTFLGAGLSILVFFWHLSPAGSTMWHGLKNRSNTYSFALWAPRIPFAYMPTLSCCESRRGELKNILFEVTGVRDSSSL